MQPRQEVRTLLSAGPVICYSCVTVGLIPRCCCSIFIRERCDCKVSILQSSSISEQYNTGKAVRGEAQELARSIAYYERQGWDSAPLRARQEELRMLAAAKR